jgi:ubiquinone/menaquinone biosynthesis C-methylase UbiE
MRRVPSVELLDYDVGSPDEVRMQLDDLWRINRWLGGVSSNLRLLGRFFQRTGKHPVRVLEVGAGDGRLAGRLGRELRRQGIQSEFVVLDRRLSHLLLGLPDARGLHRLAADALALPFPDGTFDLATCNLFFHHFSGEAALRLLRALGSVAREAVLVSDLARHWLPYLFIRTAPCVTRNPMSRQDGAASVRQAYTRKELGELAAAAGFTDFEVFRLAPFRLGLVIWICERR